MSRRKKTAEPEFRTVAGKIVSRQNMPLWEGDIAVLVPEEPAPGIRWKGSKIPKRLLLEMASFFRHANSEWKSEAQLRLAYDFEAGAWTAIALPQTVGTGMTSNEIKAVTAEEKERRAEALARLGVSFLMNGTAHSHCDGSAFASSVDSKDESTQNGVHLTFGKVAQPKIEIHGRVTFRGISYPISWGDWLENPPEPTTESGSTIELDLPEEFPVEFPEWWLDMCSKQEPAKYESFWTGRQACSAGDYYAGYPEDHATAFELENMAAEQRYKPFKDEDPYVQLVYDTVLDSTNSRALAGHMARRAALELDCCHSEDDRDMAKEALNIEREYAGNFAELTFEMLTYCDSLEIPITTFKKAIDDVLKFSLAAYGRNTRFAPRARQLELPIGDPPKEGGALALP